MSRIQKYSLFLLSASIRPVWSSFSLNVSGQDWDYTVKDLADTTSGACQTAYSAQIDCDETLQGLVASMRPDFDPTSEDLDRTCTTTCSDSLASYIQNVIKACDQPGDLANEAVTSNTVAAKDPVALIGQIFQFNFVQSCQKNSTGYCTLQDSDASDSNNFSCDDECSSLFYTNAHNYAASGWLFNYYYLVKQSSWWQGEYSTGWKTAQSCGAKEDLHPIASLPGGDVASGSTVITTGTASASTASTATGSSSGLGHTSSSTAATTSVVATSGQSASRSSSTATVATRTVSANDGANKAVPAVFAVLACIMSLTWV